MSATYLSAIMSTGAETVTSKDGTRIAIERAGSGPPLVLVDGAMCYRAFGPTPRCLPRLAPHFSVVAYDRRGRGESGDTQPYSVDREIDDLDAVIRAAGGRPWVVGFSSGGALALEAAARGVPMRGLFAYEPPYVAGAGPGMQHLEPLRAILAAGKKGKAVTYFMHDMVGAPAFVAVMMKMMPWVWRKLTAVADTLAYDTSVMGDFTVPAGRLGTIATPTWLVNGSKTDGRLKEATRLVAAAVPGAIRRELAGQTHNLGPDALLPALLEMTRA